MGIFDKYLKKEEEAKYSELDINDTDIVAIADGELIDIHTVGDPVFAAEIMGQSAAFNFRSDKVVLCAPANGTLTVLFPKGHAYGLLTNDGVELLVHCGIDTVNANTDGFKLLSKKQGDTVKAGDPIVEVDIKKLSSKYDMSTMLIITNPNNKEFKFIDHQSVTRGQKIIK